MAILGSTIVNGDLTSTGKITAVNFYSTSDKELKENIKEVKDINFKEILDKIILKEFNFKCDKDKNLIIGIIAQELEQILPNEYLKSMIYINDDGFYSINETKLIYWLIGALKEEIKRNDNLEDRVKKLEEKVGD